MTQNTEKSTAGKDTSSFRPLAYLSAFFHPVSDKSLNETLERAQEILDRTAILHSDTEKLHAQIDEVLGKKSVP